MVPDGRTEWTDGQTHGRRQKYIPPTSWGDNKNTCTQLCAVRHYFRDTTDIILMFIIINGLVLGIK